MRDTVVSTKHPLGPWPNIWFSILAACFVTLTLSNGSFQATAISTATVAPLFLFYIALLSRPSGRVRYLPYIGDFEDAVHHLSWRIAVMLILALIGRSIVYGVALDAVASTLARTLAHSLSQGLLQAGSWYMLTKAVRVLLPAAEHCGSSITEPTHFMVHRSCHGDLWPRSCTSSFYSHQHRRHVLPPRVRFCFGASASNPPWVCTWQKTTPGFPSSPSCCVPGERVGAQLRSVNGAIKFPARRASSHRGDHRECKGGFPTYAEHAV
jgi:hypothetical protein